jgi:hypothetical protein
MRIVGQYKGEDINLTDLHMSETYGGFLLGPSEKRLEETNRRLADEDIPQWIVKVWGENRPSYIYDLGIDYKARLPSVRVIVWLTCNKGIKDGDLSDLILAWFQESDDDPFAKLISNLKKFNWEDKAKDYLYSDF